MPFELSFPKVNASINGPRGHGEAVEPIDSAAILFEEQNRRDRNGGLQGKHDTPLTRWWPRIYG